MPKKTTKKTKASAKSKAAKTPAPQEALKKTSTIKFPGRSW
jgi:hypothetical protein